MAEKEKLFQMEAVLASEFEAISEYIFAHPELGNEEYESSRYLSETLASYGFSVHYPYLDIPTAFRAEFTNGDGPKIAFLAEYDALPGYGKEKQEVAHACGHNWIAASTLGAAITLSKCCDLFQGTIVVIGTPAEETTGGKAELVEKGAFYDIDAAMQMHLGAENNINVVTLAMDSIEFNFHGLAAHAAAYPEKGINALDGVQLMFAGINALRQHMRNDARVAGIITKGGVACNTVPDEAGCRFYIRAKDRAYLTKLTERVIDCARGAALMCGAELEYHNFENSYDDLNYHDGMRNILKQNLELLGITSFVASDEEASGSSDVGNVSHVCPLVYCEIETGANPKVYAHHEDFLNYVHGELAQHSLHTAIKAMAATALDIYQTPSIVQKK